MHRSRRCGKLPGMCYARWGRWRRSLRTRMHGSKWLTVMWMIFDRNTRRWRRLCSSSRWSLTGTGRQGGDAGQEQASAQAEVHRRLEALQKEAALAIAQAPSPANGARGH